jgi:hypothetical protein
MEPKPETKQEKPGTALRLMEPGPETENGRPIATRPKGKFSTTIMEGYRLLRDEETGHTYLSDRHDLVKPKLELLNVTQRDGKYVYAYRILNAADAADPVTRAIFLTEVDPELESTGSVIWFDRAGVAPGKEATFTITSWYPPHKTTAYVQAWIVDRELERIETRPVPQGVRREFFEYMEQSTDPMVDSIPVEVVGPLPDSKAK